MARILDHDPVTGMTTYGRHEDGKLVVYYEQDVETELEICKEIAKTDDHWNKGVKQSWLHYAHLPDSIVMQLFQHGVNIYSHDVDMKDVFRIVNEKYPHFKLTTKTHDKNSRWL